MSALTHQHIVHRINFRAEIERDNAQMDEIERAAAPLFYAVFSIAAAVMLWILTSDYRDVLQHRLDTMADRQQYERISATLAGCANGGLVTFDDGLMTCKFKKLDLVAQP